MNITQILFGTGRMRPAEGRLGTALRLYAAAISVWIVYSVTIKLTDLFGLTILFLSAMLVLVFLRIAPTPESTSERPGPVDWGLALLSAASGAYFWLNLDTITNRITLFDPLSTPDLLFGTLILLLTLEATRRSIGWGLTLIVLLFLSYNLFGDAIPGRLNHGEITFPQLIDISVYTTDGIFGVPLRVAATYAFMFVLFGTLLERTGGGEFFQAIGAHLTGRQIGGTAKIAIVSSAGYGMVSGSPTSDVVTTGAITIPAMTRSGYQVTTASAIEVAASTGGSLLPPVMGSVAFIMAEYTGIHYEEIAVAAIVPALLYYFGIFVQVHYRSKRLGMRGLTREEMPPLMTVVRTAPIFVIPFGTIIAALVVGYSALMAAAYGTAAVLLASLLRKETRLSLPQLYEALSEATLKMVGVTAACAAAGLVIGGLGMTGLSAKFSTMILLVSGQYMLLSLILVAAVTILLGMGMPTPSVYILATVLVGPVLAKYGLSDMTANMFLLYFSVLSASTPPVAVAAYAASAISGGNPITIASKATRLSIAAFIVPFTFAYSPELLLIGGIPRIAVAIVTAVIGIYLVGIAVEGYWNREVSVWSRLLLGAAGLCFVVPSLPLAACGAALAAAAYAIERALGGRAPVSGTEAVSPATVQDRSGPPG